MKLLTNKQIKKASEKSYFKSGYSDAYSAGKRSGFCEGAEFAEQQLLPLMVEFARFCSDVWTEEENHLSTPQLLEQYIKERNEKLK